ncbi:hypothetical protein BCR43DRAFT_485252, partial [Syncephalastrum racemosum]
MAAASFLETTNLVGLGLSADKVFSHVTDFNAPATPPKVGSASSSSSTRGESVPAATSGMKLMSEMVDSSYKMFDGLGKFWQGRNETAGARMKPSSSSNSSTSGGMMEEMKRQVNRVRASSIAESELKDMAATEDRQTNKTRGDALQALLMAPSQLIHKNNPRAKEGPIQKFLDMRSVEELRIGEVAELLADYKRLAAIIKQAEL